MFNLAIDSKLRACDLMSLRVRDVCHGQSMASRARLGNRKSSGLRFECAIRAKRRSDCRSPNIFLAVHCVQSRLAKVGWVKCFRRIHRPGRALSSPANHRKEDLDCGDGRSLNLRCAERKGNT
jgi:hypothetical protein